jgi:membrane protein involved in colicin uptake
MSGISAATAIALGSLAVASVGTSMSIYSGMQQQGAQEKALKNQTTAKDQAEANALSTERKNETATNAANQKKPDISSILASAASMSKVGGGSTMLTGATGIDSSGLSLGKTSLLGS